PVGVGHGALGLELTELTGDRVLLLPGRDLLLGAEVGLLLAFVVPTPAVGLALDQRRPLAGPGAGDAARRRLVDGEDVVAVDDDAGDAVTRGASGHVRHGMRVGGRRLRGVHVVLADVEHRQLPGRGDVEAFVERSRVGGAVAEKGDGNAALPVHLSGEPRAGDDRDAAADDAVGAEHADAEIGDVHRAALAFAVARL